MTKILGTIAALTIMGAAALPVPASAAEHGLTQTQSTEFSSQRRWHRHYYRHWGPRFYGYHHRYWGPRYRYGYYGYPYRHYGYYGYPYYHRPALAFRFGPFGFGAF